MINLKDKRILVTGGCGTIGRELIRQLLAHYEIGELVALDNNESALFHLEQEFGAPHASFFLADIRDPYKLTRKMRDMQVVFHTAAFKHVILCERSPFEAVQTNIMGVQNVISAALENGVEKVIFTSSDKAVNPTNVMGTSKLMGERLISATNSTLRGEDRPVFVSTRFGNVLGSRGSVIPIFREQIRRGGPVTLTDPAMTRFIMSIQEAVRLVIESSALACGGEVFITKMPVIRIQDLAEVMIEELAPRYGHRAEQVQIVVIGAKPGEKMYEELMSLEETRRAIELERYFSVPPAFRSLYQEIDYQYQGVVATRVENPYNSSNESPLSKEELRQFLDDNNLLADDSENPS